MVEFSLPTSKKGAKKEVGYFQEVRQSQRVSWIQYASSITSSTTSQQLWRKVKAANGLNRDFTIPILETLTAIYSSPVDVANLIGQTFASVSSSDSYSPAFQVTKNRLERTPINFRCRQSLSYNCDFDMWELKRALSSAHNTSPGPDGISYELLRHLNEDSLVGLLYLFNPIWRELVYPTQWQEAIVIPILKPGNDPKDPLSYRPIALTSCLCKTLERMVNALPAKKRFTIPTLEHATFPLDLNPFASYSKTTVIPIVFQRIFAYHRSRHRSYSPVSIAGS
ncbi:putative RNA-directed DNA polymerase from transposon X-element [Trichonephila clavipes]|nr:putative RNA-directed DNA polymerase from transposon X-element [Trichonephila clavipes]